MLNAPAAIERARREPDQKERGGVNLRSRSMWSTYKTRAIRTSALCLVAVSLAVASAAQEPPKQPDAWPIEEVLAALHQCVQKVAPIQVLLSARPAIKAADCGMRAPVDIETVGTSAVAFKPKLTVDCGLAPALEAWIERVVQPAAQQHLSDTIASVSAAGYQCRSRTDGPVKRISEHGTGNAVDIFSFETRGGHKISVLDHWGPIARDGGGEAAGKASQPKVSTTENRSRSRNLQASERMALGHGGLSEPPLDPKAQFLRAIHQGACGIFKTTLGPDSNNDHRNHFHYDLAARRGGATYCR